MPRMLLSLSRKEGMVEFARAMHEEFGFELYASDGTGRALAAAGLAITKVEDYTKIPEMMNGRIKTLGVPIHGGILGRIEDEPIMQELGILRFDMVVCNFYPFEEAVRNRQPFPLILDKIDVGGPSSVVGPAKNFGLCVPVVNPLDYDEILAQYRSNGELSTELLLDLGAEAAQEVADFYGSVAKYYRHMRRRGVPEANAFREDLRRKRAG